MTLTFERDAFFRAYWWLLTALLVGYIWNSRPVMSPNDAARWDTVWSLVEFGTYQIFDTKKEADKHGKPEQFETIDKVTKDDKLYSSKPPLLPTVVAGFVAALRTVIKQPFSKDAPRKPDSGTFHFYIKATLIVFNVLPFLGMLILYRRFLDRLRLSDEVWVFCLLTVGVGTLTTGYLVTFNNHVIAGWSAFFCAYLLMTLWYDHHREWWRFALCGLTAAWTAANELPAVFFALAAFALCWRLDRQRTMGYFLPPAAVVTLAFFYTTNLQLGSLVPAYLNRKLYDYPDSYWRPDYEKKSGIDALSLPNENGEYREATKIGPFYWSPTYFLHMTVGHHGLFSLTPLWLFALWGMWELAHRRDLGWRGLWWPILLLSAVIFGFYWLLNTERNYGGFCHGMRWLLWLAPLWLLLLPFGVARAYERGGRAKRLAFIALLVSIISMADTLYNPWTRSWIHRIFYCAGVIDY